MSKSTLPRLKALRDEMGKAGITAFIIPGTDPHQSEYYASHWAARTWISGFDGSAGTAVVTTNQAGLWTDSRYFLQAAQQLEDSGFMETQQHFIHLLAQPVRRIFQQRIQMELQIRK